MQIGNNFIHTNYTFKCRQLLYMAYEGRKWELEYFFLPRRAGLKIVQIYY